MGILTWISSDWLTPPLDRGDSSPFYPWPEDWLTRRTMQWIYEPYPEPKPPPQREPWPF